MKKIISISCFLFTFLITGILAQEIEGRYKVLEGKEPLTPASFKKLKVVEVFSFTCPHCYSFQKQLNKFEEKYKNKVELTHLPIGYSGVNPSKLYFIALENKKGAAVKKLIFQSFHDSGIRNINNPQIIKTLAKISGIENIYQKQQNNSAILDRIKFAQFYASSRGIASTPSFVIENTLVVEGADVKNLSKVLDSLLIK